jgi:hypothetical protein
MCHRNHEMGYHIILTVSATLKPEFVGRLDFLLNYEPGCGFKHEPEPEPEPEEEPDSLIAPYVNIWKSLEIGHHFYEFKQEDNELELRIEKKPYHHSGHLSTDYIEFVEKILCPMTTRIHSCCVSHDDYDIPSTYYSDDELRNAHFIVAYVPASLPAIQIGKRHPVEKPKNKFLSVQRLYPDIYNSDSNTWPECLRNWWHQVSSDPDKVVQNLRECYSEDETLLEIADWMDEMIKEGQPDNKTKFKYKCNLNMGDYIRQ